MWPKLLFIAITIHSIQNANCGLGDVVGGVGSKLTLPASCQKIYDMAQNCSKQRFVFDLYFSNLIILN